MSEAHDDKLKFQSKEEASATAIVAKNNYGGTRLKPYFCDGCKLWHLTSDFDDED